LDPGNYFPEHLLHRAAVLATEKSPMKLTDVNEAFATDEQCLAYLENKRDQLYQCFAKSCNTQFSAPSSNA
jgi:hypothetical protein